MLTKELARDRSRVGAAFFDKAFPSWPLCIETETLSIAHSDACMLGQMCGTFDNGQRYFHIPEERAVEFGLLVNGPPCAEKTADYQLLTEVWRELTIARQREAGPALAKSDVKPPIRCRRVTEIATGAIFSLLYLLFIW